MAKPNTKGLTSAQIRDENKDIEGAKPIVYTELENRLRVLIQNTIEDYKRFVFPEAYEIIKMKTLFSGDVKVAYMKAGWENKSCDVYPLIDSIHDTYVSNMYDTTVSNRAIARNQDDIGLTQQAQDFYDWCYSITGAEDVKEDIRNEACLIGTGYGQAGFKNYECEKEYQTDLDETKKISIKEMKPTLEHVSFFELFYPISTSNFYDSQWKFRRKILSYDTIKQKYSRLINFDVDTEEGKENVALIKDSNSHISTIDFNKIWDIKTYENAYISACSSDTGWLDKPSSFVYENLFNVVENKNNLNEVIEYREEDKLIIMINGRVLYDGHSPYPTGMPFGIVTYEKRPGTCRGRGIGHKLMTHQKQANTYYNQIINGINMHIDPMYLIQVGQLVGKDGQTPKRIKHIPGGTLETKDASVNNGGIKPLDFIDFNIISLAMRDLENCRGQAQEIIGVNSYSQGGQGKIERSFGAVNARLGVVRSRLQPIIKSINRFDSFMFETWLAVSKSLMDEELEIRVLGNEGIERWQKVKPADILNRFDFECDSEAGRQATKNERAQTMVNIVNTLSPLFIDPITKVPLVDPGVIVQKAIEQLDFVGVTVMTPEEQEAYVNKSIKIMAMMQQPQQAQPQTGEPTLNDTIKQQGAAPVAPSDGGDKQMEGESDFAYFQRTGIEKSIV